MIIAKKVIPRRTMLRGIGVSLALPLLDGMVPAFAALRNSVANPVRRLGAVYVPNGMDMQRWTPAAEGAAFELTPILEPVAPFRDRLLVLSGLNGVRGGGAHAGASTRFLTGVPGKKTDAGGSELRAAISIDQIVAKEFRQHTQLASLELGLDGRDFAGSCDAGYSCAYTNSISWRSATTPLPMENNPRVVFERLFGDGGSTDTTARLARIHEDRSILDSVIENVADLQRSVGPSDRTKIDQYLEAVRDVERRIQKAEQQSARELPVLEQPAGIPVTTGEHVKLMFNLQVLAYQVDLTRVITFMIGRELTGRSYPEFGAPEGHHPLSHHQNDPVKMATLAKINTYHVELFADFVEKLRSTPDGDGSLLDHILLIYGAGLSDSNAHSSDDLPILLVGGARGRLMRGRHVRYASGTPMANLLLTVMDLLNMSLDAIGDSTETLELLSVA